MVCYAVTDVLGQSLHPNPMESRDVEALENEYFESVESLNQLGRNVRERLTWQA